MKRLLLAALFSYPFLHAESKTFINNSCYNAIIQFSSLNKKNDDIMWLSVFVPCKSTITIDPFDLKYTDPIIEKSLYTQDKLFTYRAHFKENFMQGIARMSIRPTKTIFFDEQRNSFFYIKMLDYSCPSLVVGIADTSSTIRIDHKKDHLSLLEFKANPLNITI